MDQLDLKEKEVSGVIENESALYVTQVTADLDEDETENRKETLLNTKKTEHFNSVLATWKEEYPLTVEEAVWEQVVFDRSYEIKAE